jgi:hypothetical protein
MIAAAVAVVMAFTILLVPLMVWAVRAVKRQGWGLTIASALFYGMSQVIGGAPQYIETVKDPERKKRSESGGPDQTPEGDD